MFLKFLSVGAPEVLIVATVLLLAAAVWWIGKVRKDVASHGEEHAERSIDATGVHDRIPRSKRGT